MAVFIACDRIEPYLTYRRDRRPEAFGSAAANEPDPGAGRVTTAELDQVPTVTPDDHRRRREEAGHQSQHLVMCNNVHACP